MRVSSISEVADFARNRFERLARTHHGDEAFPARLPPGDGLRLLLEEAFWASILRDEGRPCRFTVAYYGIEVGDANPDVTVALDPKPFQRDRLRRLAAVARAAEAEIAVAPAGNDLLIVGLTKPFGQPNETERSAVMLIEVEVLGPAQIVVRYAIFRVLTYRNGELPEPGPNILDMAGPFKDALDSLATSKGLPGGGLRFPLKSLLAQVERNAHGGLLVLSASEPKGLESVSWRTNNHGYSLADADRLWSDNLRKLDLGQISFYQARDAQRGIRALEFEIVRLATSLALTDGAVWLDGGLQPRAFGVFARLDPGQGITSSFDAAGTNRRETTFDTLGARHRAMVALAGQNPGCPAIGVSVDGGFSAALRVEGQEGVLLWSFQGVDLDVDDPFDPQYRAIWEDILAQGTIRRARRASSSPGPSAGTRR